VCARVALGDPFWLAAAHPGDSGAWGAAAQSLLRAPGKVLARRDGGGVQPPGLKGGKKDRM